VRTLASEHRLCEERSDVAEVKISISVKIGEIGEKLRRI
jgi:hypothetical protein